MSVLRLSYRPLRPKTLAENLAGSPQYVNFDLQYSDSSFGHLRDKGANSSYFLSCYQKLSCFIDINLLLGDDSGHPSGDLGGVLGLLLPSRSHWGVKLYLHQNAFPSNRSVEVDTIAKRALALLAATQRESSITSSDIMALPDSAPLVARLYEAATSNSRDALDAVVKDVLKAGISVQHITSLLVPAVARQLGKDWENDTASFGMVTIACARLQAAVRRLEGYATQNSMTQQAQLLNCLVVVPEGAQHTLGAVVLATQLRQAGSHVQLAVGSSTKEMTRLARTTSYDIAMISASIGQDLHALRALVDALREAASATRIVVGGALLEHHADLERKVGADLVTNNWKEALLLSMEGVSLGDVGV